jgi:outer membrane protein TolC
LKGEIYVLRKIKKVGVLTMLIIFLLVIPAEAKSDNPEDLKKTQVLTLDDSFKRAGESNSQVKIAELEAREAEIQYANARKTASRISTDEVNTYELAKKKYVAPRQAEAQANIKKSDIELLKKQLKFNVEKAYYTVLHAEDMVKVNEKALERAKVLLDVAVASFKAEIVPKSDVLEAQVQVNQAQANLITAQKIVKEAKMQLNRLVGLPLDTPIELTKKLTFEQINIDLDESIQEAILQREEIKQAGEMLKLREMELEVAKKFFTPSVYEYDQKQIAIEKQKSVFEDRKTDVELEVRKAFLNIEEAKERYLLSIKSLESARESERIAMLRYKAGVTTNVEVISAQFSLNKAETDVVKSLFDYNLAVREFYFTLGR